MDLRWTLFFSYLLHCLPRVYLADNCQCENSCTESCFSGQQPCQKIYRIAEANPPLTTSLSLDCGPSNDDVGYYWMYGTTFLNLKSITSESRTDIYSSLIDGGHILLLRNLTSVSEGVYRCQVPTFSTDLNPALYVVLIEGHAFFKSCPESRNGKNCATTKVLQSEIGSTIMFDTTLGYRNGGSCGIKQRMAELELWKVLDGKVLKLYRCWVISSSYCPNSKRISSSYHSKDKSDFHLNLNNVKHSDAGQYEARIKLMDYRYSNTRFVTITRMFQLKVKTDMFWMLEGSSQGCYCQINHLKACSLGDQEIRKSYRIGQTIAPLTTSVEFKCRVGGVRNFDWKFGTSFSSLNVIDIKSNPDISERIMGGRSILILRNIKRGNEGMYHCSSPHFYIPQPVYVLIVEGHAFFKTCPESSNGRNCSTRISLKSEVGSSIRFDARLGYRDVGSCGFKQAVKAFELFKVQDGRGIDKLYRCFRICSNSSRISTYHKRSDRSDFHVTLNDLRLSDAGEYEAHMILYDNRFFLKTLTITRKYELLFTERTRLLLNGKVLAENTKLYVNQLGHGDRALLCVTDNENCCAKPSNNNIKAEFRRPNGSPIGGFRILNLYVTRGYKVIRLNYHSRNLLYPFGILLSRRGQYCCTISNAQGVVKSHCIIFK